VSSASAAASTVIVDRILVSRLGAVEPPANTPPVAAVTVTSQSGRTVSVSGSGSTDPDGTVSAWAWSFGDGGTATGASTSHAYAVPGSYPVTLTVTDAVGNSTTRSGTTAVTPAIPAITAITAITTFKLTKKTISIDEKTKLKVRVTAASTLKVVIKSKHRHLVKGKRKYLKIVLEKQIPAGLSKITIKGRKLKPDAYVIRGTAANTTGTSPKKKAKLTVVR
jgi:PKD repeat protein